MKTRAKFLKESKERMLKRINIFLLLWMVYISMLLIPRLIYPCVRYDLLVYIYVIILAITLFFGIPIGLACNGYSSIKMGVRYDGKKFIIMSDEMVWNSIPLKDIMGFDVKPNDIERVEWYEEHILFIFNSSYINFKQMPSLKVRKYFIADETKLKNDIRSLGIKIVEKQ